jgi:hypothetical protein
MNKVTSWIAFDGTKKISYGSPDQVAADVKTYVDAYPHCNLLAFDAITSQQLDMDAPGSLFAALYSLPGEQLTAESDSSTQELNPTKSVGRPKLGVTAKEVTLLPRHWDWLTAQPGGASVALRKLVEQAQRANKDLDRMRVARDAAYKFMNAMAGNEPGFEEATRALFAGNLIALRSLTEAWPKDIRDHNLLLAEASLIK